ncbi:complement C1r subcomponent-like protein, partial [Carlito syrichta]|uniref:Complement C1r subcomponent-like protein n=1 Tax=Carlito syrichta TaxID=1868482 RepID=A0A3Q0DFQ8_CARSF
VSARGKKLGRLCGQQGSPPSRPPGQREFVSSEKSLRLAFRTHAASEDEPTHPHQGFLALHQAVAVNHSQPLSQASRDSEAICTPEDDPSEAQNHCREPFYQAAPAGTLSCAAPRTWEGRPHEEEAPPCVP